MRARTLVVVAVITAGAAVAATIASQKPAPEPTVKKPLRAKTVSAEERREALSRAQVWMEPPPIAQASLGVDPGQPAEITCTFLITELGGTAPKFDCALPNGNRARIKYGRSPEVLSEVASARLLHTLGFGADNVEMLRKVRCYGCPAQPFYTMKTLGLAGAEKVYARVMDPNDYKDFEPASIERRHYGRPIRTEEVEGWAFFELDLIDPAKGGAPRAHVDALRLLAVMLAHWDNKSENQRLVCLSESDWPENGKCAKPFAMLQDVGSAWGPRKVDLPEWKEAPIWADRATCTISMDTLPYHGATFTPVKITEAGRKHLGGLLSQLSDKQIEDLFRGARFDQPTGFIGLHASPIAGWVQEFTVKVKQITEGPPCPQ